MTPITDRGHSAVGDVDGDGIPEALIEMTNQIKIIKAFSDDSFYVWETIYMPFNYAWVFVSDLDNNGINDIIVVGHNKILVYEWSTYVEETGIVDNKNYSFKNSIVTSLSKFRDKGIKVFDVSGRMFTKSQFLHQGGNNPPYPLHQGGIYFIKLKDSEKCIKIIKIR